MNTPLPRSVFVVVDEAGIPGYCAPYAQACHEHINDAIEHDINAAGWVVREYVLAQQAEPVKRQPATGAASCAPSASFQLNAHWVPKDKQQAERELTSERITEFAVLSRLLNPPQIGVQWSAPLPGSDYLDRLQTFAQYVAAEIEKQQAEPGRKPLTEDEKLRIIDNELEGGSLLDVATAVERAVWEKNK